MMEIEKPNITVEENDSRSFARITVEPLEKGFGITIGNCLRRILLSSLPGAAPVGIRIEGVKHEFSTIPGVKEDVTEIILNIKNLAVKCNVLDKGFRKTLTLKAEGPKTVYASDFAPDAEIEILNPELYLATLDEGAKLDMEVTIGKGRGYTSADANKSDKNPIDFIAVDSIYTPIKKVNYAVEATRVGQSIDYDKLVLEVTTNGAFSGREIVSLAAKIMEDHIRLFVDLSDSMSAVNIMTSPDPGKSPKVLEMNIEDMDLSVRSYNCLKRAGIHTVEDLTKKSEDDMLKVRNLGKKSLDEVIHKLNSYGLNLRNKDE